MARNFLANSSGFQMDFCSNDMLAFTPRENASPFQTTHDEEQVTQGVVNLSCTTLRRESSAERIKSERLAREITRHETQVFRDHDGDDSDDSDEEKESFVDEDPNL